MRAKTKIFFKYLGPMLAVSIIPLVLSGLVLFLIIGGNLRKLEDSIIDRFRTDLRNEVSLKNEYLAAFEGKYAEEEIDRIFFKAEAISHSPSFQLMRLDEIENLIESLIEDEPAVLELSVIDRGGSEIYRKKRGVLLSQPSGTENPGTRQVWEKIESGNPFLGEVELDENASLPVITIGLPIRRSGNQTIGGLVVKYDLDFLWNITASKILGESGFLFIVSKGGKLISHPDKKELYQMIDFYGIDYVEEALEKKKGTLIRSENIISFSTNKYGWTIFVVVPEREAMLPVMTNRATVKFFIEESLRSVVIATIILVLLAISLATFSSIFITKKIIEPIVSLTDATRQVTEGDLSVRLKPSSSDELGELTSAFNTMTEELKRNRDDLIKTNDFVRQQAIELENRYNSDLEQFAYITTHDLKEPLRQITSYIQLMEHRYSDSLPDQAKDYMTYVVEGALRMSRIVNDLFEYAHIRTDLNKLVPVNFSNILEKVISNLETEIREADATITIKNLPKALRADEAYMVQLFQNLLGNALKFRKSRNIEIHIQAEEKLNEWLFWVQDNGIGLNPAYSEKIFEIFKRLHSKEEYPGTGMGLAICKNIVERHQGKIWVESVEGQGTTFYFTIRKTLTPQV